MCLTNPASSFNENPTASSLVACNPSDPTQAFQNIATTTITTSFRSNSPQFLTFNDAAFINKLLGAFLLASTSYKGAQVTLGSTETFSSKNSAGQAGTVSVAYASSALGGLGGVPLETMRSVFAGVMVSQFGSSSSTGTLPANVEIQANNDIGYAVSWPCMFVWHLNYACMHVLWAFHSPSGFAG